MIKTLQFAEFKAEVYRDRVRRDLWNEYVVSLDFAGIDVMKNVDSTLYDQSVSYPWSHDPLHNDWYWRYGALKARYQSTRLVTLGQIVACAEGLSQCQPNLAFDIMMANRYRKAACFELAFSGCEGEAGWVDFVSQQLTLPREYSDYLNDFDREAERRRAFESRYLIRANNMFESIWDTYTQYGGTEIPGDTNIAYALATCRLLPTTTSGDERVYQSFEALDIIEATYSNPDEYRIWMRVVAQLFPLTVNPT